MYGKIITLKFKDMGAAQLGAAYFSENVGLKISEFDISGFNIYLSQDGDLSISVKFNHSDGVKHFSRRYPDIVNGLRKNLPFTEKTFVGVCAFTFEKEAALTESR